MKADSITIDVNAKVSVSDETAERCLRLLEIWQEDNPDKYIAGKDNGKRIVYQICERRVMD